MQLSVLGPTLAAALLAFWWALSRPDYSSEYIAIRQTLNTYCLAIDSKDYGLLDQIFTTDIEADYSTGVGVLSGLPHVQNVMLASLATVHTQHGLSTQVIDVTSSTTANSTSYFTTTHLGCGAYEGVALYAVGKYLDSLVKLSDGGIRFFGSNKQSAWRVSKRELVYTGSGLVGNLSAFSGVCT